MHTHFNIVTLTYRNFINECCASKLGECCDCIECFNYI